MTVTNNQNQRYTLSTAPFAKGGEGSIYDVIGMPNLVAKIYHPQGRTETKEQKLSAMIASPPLSATNQIAWPLDIVYDVQGNFLGFVMNRVGSFTKIDSLYSYDKRSNLDFSFYLAVAKNLCAAVGAVHNSGHVCGDLNPANICVDPKTALVTLVDTDSYQIKNAKGEYYVCPVCRPEYVPAEVHKIMDNHSSLRGLTFPAFSTYTDYFAIAVHLFALIMNGAHPYSCVVTGNASASSFSIIPNIEKGIFPFVKNRHSLTAPKYAPRFDSLPLNLQNLFIASFSAKQALTPQLRPPAITFFNVITKFEQSLTTCNNNRSHKYFNRNRTCPYCEADNRVRGTIASQAVAIRKTSYNKPTTTTTTNTNTNTSTYRSTPRRKYNKLAFAFGMIVGLAVFVANHLLLLWLLSNISVDSAILRILITVVAMATIPFIPMWIYAGVFKLLNLSSGFFVGIAFILNLSIYLAYALYVGVMIYTFYDDWLSLVLNSILICLPAYGLSRILPFLTSFLIRY